MRVVALISGGKDSCYNMMQCVQHGHEIVALANLRPENKDELDSYMFQTVGHNAIDLYAEAMGLPLYRRVIRGSALELGKNYHMNSKDEVEDLYELLSSIKSDIEFDAVSVGAILSDYQRVRVEHVCSRLDISPLAFLWRRDQKELYSEMLSSGLVAIIIKVAVMGLSPKKHLGMTMEQLYPTVCKLNSQIGMNVCGEGGEFESFTLDCPLFKKIIVIDDSEIVMHSDDAFAEVGYLHFKTMHLENKSEIGSKTQKELIEDANVCYKGDVIHNIPVVEDETSRGCKQKETMVICTTLKGSNQSLKACDYINTSGGFVWISDITGYQDGGYTVEKVTKLAMEQLAAKVSSLGCKLMDAVLMHLFVRNMSDFSKVNSVYKEYFPINPPARACIEVGLDGDAILKMDCLLPRQQSLPDAYHTSHDDDEHSDVPRHREAMHVQSISHWASANIGPYSQAIKVEPLMFVSGNIGLWPASMELVEGGISAQSSLSLRHVDRIISAFSPQQSILNVILGYCYVTRTEDISTARKAWSMAINAKRDEATDADVQADGVMVYVVVPCLPKGALVEWQVTTCNSASHELEQNSSLINCGENTLELQRVWCTSSHHSCCIFNCAILPSAEPTPSNLDNIISSYAQELERIFSQREFAQGIHVEFPQGIHVEFPHGSRENRIATASRKILCDWIKQYKACHCFLVLLYDPLLFCTEGINPMGFSILRELYQ